MVKGATIQSPGGEGGAGIFVADKLFISTRLDGALKISNFNTCFYKTFLKSKLFISCRVCPKSFISKILQPSPWRLKGGPNFYSQKCCNQQAPSQVRLLSAIPSSGCQLQFLSVLAIDMTPAVKVVILKISATGVAINTFRCDSCQHIWVVIAIYSSSEKVQSLNILN